MMKQLTISKSAGFCFGVSRSIDLVEKMLSEGGSCYSLGQLIHNDAVVRSLADRGLKVVEEVSEIPEGARVIIRSHGIPKSVYTDLERKGVEVIDATCPKVSHIHKIVAQASTEGRTPVIIGSVNHPEVQAICGWCEHPHVFLDDKELAEWLQSDPKNCEIPLTVVYQTTQTKEKLENSQKILNLECTNVKVFDTICSATSTRQKEARLLAETCDAMVVIGGKHSANSVHLAEICRMYCGNVQFVDSADELDLEALNRAEKIGITAGASAPSWIIKEVKQKMCDEIKIEETTAENIPEAEETEKSFAELLEESIKTINNGDTVSGVVVAITSTEITVDLGTKHSGFIPVEDFTDGTDAKIEDLIKIGDQVEASVVRVNDVEGTVMLSKKRLDAVKNWNEIEAAQEEGTVLEGVVTEENKGGVVVFIKGIRVFVPASQTGLGKDAPMSGLLKQTVRLRITEVNRSRRRVVGSIRAVQYKERKERAEKIWNEIEIGKHYNGKVKSLTSYGAFVDIGGIDGMVHVSELSWSRIKQPSDVLSVGDDVDVYVINFDKDSHKISLGYKDPDGNPWTKFTNAYEVGSVANVKIVKLMPFGAFAEVIPGVDGLIHISQIANRRIGKPDEVLTVGETVDAKITNIDDDNKKISLSIRALSEPEPAPAKEREVEEAPVYRPQKGPREDALVYSISVTGEATGIKPEIEETEE
ncbi:MAG: bifunctional 4-hydroxy-3-methylbut-2-enyl diphosphate reductase/30S ribosomal protein S1 [Oscillospiraceae bacterium]|jgi:(E)-4-hydroxy-3-methyl-but-2-enyl pyrophosphate reductase